MISLSLITELVIVVLAVPVLALSLYWCIELISSSKYPRDLEQSEVHLVDFPKVSLLISAFNEKFVIGRSLEAMEKLDYPHDRIQIVVADDSTDETVQIIDEKVSELNRLGITAVVSRRPTRENYKCGALNKAMDFVTGEYVLLLDADSVVPPDIFSKGIDAIQKHSNASFVSFRYGHYNRDYNLTTRLFALSQDLADTTSKMGAYLVDAPFSLQGGFTLVRTKDLREVGMWTNGRIADDTDISIKFYMQGKRGIYLSNVSIMSEDPSSLEVWKKQVARTSQGWWRCIAKYSKQLITSRNISIRTKLGIFLMLAATFSSLNWILITFLSAFAIVFGVISPANSIFSNPLFIGVLVVPYVLILLSAAWALKIQDLLTVRNLTLIPALIFAEVSVVTLSSLGFFYGVFDRTGFFNYRTPKSGSSEDGRKSRYLQGLANDRNAIIEGAVSASGVVLGVLVLFHGMWFLSLAMVGFALATLKSMNLSRYIRPTQLATAEQAPSKIAVPTLGSIPVANAFEKKEDARAGRGLRRHRFGMISARQNSPTRSGILLSVMLGICITLAAAGTWTYNVAGTAPVCPQSPCPADAGSSQALKTNGLRKNLDTAILFVLAALVAAFSVVWWRAKPPDGGGGKAPASYRSA